MKSNSKWNWLVVFSAVAVFSFLVTGNVHAWGPFSQNAIAQTAQQAPGVPAAIGNDLFVYESTMPKAYENTDQDYAATSYNFSDFLFNNLQGMTEYCQALSWGSAQTAEKAGDYLFFNDNSYDNLDRWFNELFCDALLLCVESPYYGMSTNTTAVLPKMVSDASIVYAKEYGDPPFSGIQAVLNAHDYAFVMVGEMVVIEDPQFQANAQHQININDWRSAMNGSVNSCVEYLVNSTQAQSEPVFIPQDVDNLGAVLLSKIGSFLVATGDAAIAAQRELGVYHYRMDLSTSRCNVLTIEFLRETSENEEEDPTMRLMAGRLLELMTVSPV